MTLRWKLVLLYALILAAVIGTFSLLLVDQLKITLMQNVADELETHAKALGEALEYEQGAWRMDPESPLARDYASDPGRFYYVLNGSSGETDVILKSAHFIGIRDEAAAHPGNHDPSGAERFVQIGVVVAKTDEPPAATETRPFLAFVVCGKDVTASDEAIHTLVGKLWLLGPLVLLASLAGGWFLVSRALRPIDRIATTATEINETDLSARIPVHTRDELGRLADTLNATFDRLQRGFERERQFTADASHELRTPLAAITGNVEVGLSRERPAADHREILGEVGEAAARMQAIVEGLLALARSDEKAAPRVREKVVLARIVEDAVRAHQALADQKQVSVSVSAPEDAVVPGDPDHLRTVVSNLVANAIRYNVDGGRVGIEVVRKAATAVIRVDDTGVGIPEKDLPHVFERFYRVDQSRSTAGGGGVGLGLAIAKAIVEAHHGTIAVSRLPAGGTRFEVTLPV
jgi:heavy metal sensor kinase